MKLRDACEIAEACGLETVGEAVLNIRMHAISIFDYNVIDSELLELAREAEDYSDDIPIETILSGNGT